MFLTLTLVAAFVSFNAASAPIFAQDDEDDVPELPLILSGDDEEEEPEEAADDEQAPSLPGAGDDNDADDNDEEDAEPIPTPAPQSDDENDDAPAPAEVEASAGQNDDFDITLPGVEDKLGVETDPEVVDETDAIIEGIPIEGDLTEEQMLQLSKQPLFNEFTNTIGEIAPMPEDVDVDSLNVPGAKLVMPERQIVVEEQFPEISVEEATKKLADALDLGGIDVNALDLTPKQRTALEQLDSEIQRLCPLWIDAEINRATIGRRELVWRQSGALLFSMLNPKPVDAHGSDWAMAPDAPFFFQVTDSVSGDVYYTKAGDFEQLDQLNLLSPGLIRDEKTYLLTVEPGKVAPTGNSGRIKVLKNGKVQGMDPEGKYVTDVDLGLVPLFVFENAARLRSEDGVFFTPTPASGQPRQTRLLPSTKAGVVSGKVLLSNGEPEKIFDRIVTLCASKKNLVNIISQPRLKRAEE